MLDQLLPTRYSLSGVAAAAATSATTTPNSSRSNSSSTGKGKGSSINAPVGLILDPSGAVGAVGGAAAIPSSVDKSALSAALSSALGEGYEGAALAALREEESAAVEGAPLENEAYW